MPGDSWVLHIGNRHSTRSGAGGFDGEWIASETAKAELVLSSELRISSPVELPAANVFS